MFLSTLRLFLARTPPSNHFMPASVLRCIRTSPTFRIRQPFRIPKPSRPYPITSCVSSARGVSTNPHRRTPTHTVASLPFHRQTFLHFPPIHRQILVSVVPDLMAVTSPTKNGYSRVGFLLNGTWHPSSASMTARTLPEELPPPFPLCLSLHCRPCCLLTSSSSHCSSSNSHSCRSSCSHRRNSSHFLTKMLPHNARSHPHPRPRWRHLHPTPKTTLGNTSTTSHDATPSSPRT